MKVDGGLESISGTDKPRSEAGVDGEACESGYDASPLLENEPVGVHREVDERGLAPPNLPVDGESAAGRRDRKVPKAEAVPSAFNFARQSIDRQIGSAAQP